MSAPPGCPGSEVTGICISGGGIRAAAFGLGALQVLGRRGVLARASYLSAVSGGSYIAAALTLVTKGPILEGDAELGIIEPGPDLPAFARGSPEERYLRNNLGYLSHGPGGSLAVAARVAFGLVLNLAFLGLCLWVAILPVGWTYGWRMPALRESCAVARAQAQAVAGSALGHCRLAYTPRPGLWWALAALAGAGLLAGLVWAGKAWRRPRDRQRAGTVSGGLLLIAALGFLLAVGLPEVLVFLRGTFSGPRLPTLGGAAGAGLAGTLASVAGWLRASLGRSKQVEQAARGRLLGFLGRHRLAVVNLLAAVAGPVLVAALALLVLVRGADQVPGVPGAGAWAPVLWASPAVVLAVIYALADLNSWSLHPYYKQHLSQAFALARVLRPPSTTSPTAVDTGGGCQDSVVRPQECPYPITRSQPADHFPTLLICATANVNDYGKVPTGFNATSFVFSELDIGGPMVGWCNAGRYEAAMARSVTLPTAIAVAGAAISPEMGKMTRAPLRFLMTLANLRLGVWLPNPALVEDKGRRKPAGGRPGPSRRYGNPRPRYLFRELLGHNHLGSRFLYVTDGGHYENLGLVELMRRRCTEIFCVDASGEKMDTFDTIGQAFALARAELGITVDLDPRAQMAPRPDGPSVPGHPEVKLASSLFARGTVFYPPAAGYPYYPEGLSHPAQVGTLVIVKAGVTAETPYDIRAYQEDHPSFPCDPTTNQLYTAERFDAYRALGEFAMSEALGA